MTLINSNVKLVKINVKCLFGLVPLTIGLDKLTYRLTNWNQYVSISVATTLHFDEQSFLRIIQLKPKK